MINDFSTSKYYQRGKLFIVLSKHRNLKYLGYGAQRAIEYNSAIALYSYSRYLLKLVHLQPGSQRKKLTMCSKLLPESWDSAEKDV